MRKNIGPTLFALLLAATPAYAQFEGVLDMKMTMATKDSEIGGGGTMSVAVAKAGTRCEMNMQMGGMGVKMVILQKTDAPNTLYHIYDANNTYSEVDLAKTQDKASQPSAADRYTVEKLGQEELLGYKTQHVLVKEKNPGPGSAATSELWTAKDLLDYATFSKMQARQGKGGDEEALLKALKGAGADGVPLKSIITTTDGSKVTMEVVKVDKKSLPAGTFEIPSGYTKSAGGMPGMMGGLSGPEAGKAKQSMDDAQKRMEEAMKDMPPEQREQMEKMMKQRKAGNP